MCIRDSPNTDGANVNAVSPCGRSIPFLARRSLSLRASDPGGPMTQTIEMVVTVKAYPSVSTKYRETVCVAGVRTDTPGPTWVRLYPVVYRDLHYDLRFAKYQRINLEVSGANDPRPESLRPNLDSLKLGATLDTSKKWSERRRLVEPLMVGSMCEVLAQQAVDGSSLAVF